VKIMVDATALLLNSAGVKGVLYHWIHALRAQQRDEIFVYPPMATIASLDHQRSVSTRWATLRGLVMAVSNQRMGAPFPAWFARGMDVFHCSNQVRYPPRRCRLTATVHDLTCWKMPEFHTAANVVADREYAARVLKRADGLIAVSENTRQDAIALLNIRPERIVTIPNGVSESFFAATDEYASAVRARWKLGKPYVLSVGTIEPRKNLDRLLDAWSQLRPELREEFDLVIAGPAGWGSDQTRARLQNPPRGVFWLGYVPEADLPGLTRGATALAYVSLYEGFGLPLAQAMAAGVPAVTSSVSALPEVAAGSARLADPFSVSEIAAALTALLDNPEERRKLGEAGRRRALAEYRWSGVAARSLEFFHQI
jgi:glycosyltransferase involved in cell wall biosynthesis